MLTVLIPTLASKKTKPYVEACVASLREFTSKISILVLVNGKNALDLNVDARVIKIPQQGQCHAVNEGLEMTNTKYVMVSNDDMIYSPDWLPFLLKAVEEHKCVSPNLVEPLSGAEPFKIHNCGETVDKFRRDAWLQFVSQNHGDEGIEDGFNLPFLTETEIFKTIGGYDEAYDPFGSNSDPDVMYKMMIAGIRPKRVRDSYVYHFSLQSSSPAESEEAKKSWWTNWRYFPRKWGFERDGRGNIWYAGGKKGTRIPTEERPYVAEIAHGHGVHPGKDWLEFHPSWKGKYGKPFYGEGNYYDD